MNSLAWVQSVRAKLARFTQPPLAESPEALAAGIARIEEPMPLCALLSREEAAWITASVPDYGEGRLFAKIYCHSAGMDYELFRRAEYGAASLCGRGDARYGGLVASIYALLERASGGETDLIRKYVLSNSSRELGIETLGRFSMRWMMVADNQKAGYPKEVKERAGNDPERLELYMDAPLGFAIIYRGVENALASIWPDEPGTLLIHQLQGVRKKRFHGLMVAGRHHSHGLALFDFRKAIVEFTIDLARETGFSRLGIRGSKNNIWTNTDDDGRPHITMERASEIYDGTALRMGFSFSRDGNWYRDV